MKKPRVKKPKISSKTPGATPKGTHRGSKGSDPAPAATHPAKNLGKYLVKAKLPTGKKVGAAKSVAAKVAKAMTKSKKGLAL